MRFHRDLILFRENKYDFVWKNVSRSLSPELWAMPEDPGASWPPWMLLKKERSFPQGHTLLPLISPTFRIQRTTDESKMLNSSPTPSLVLPLQGILIFPVCSLGIIDLLDAKWSHDFLSLWINLWKLPTILRVTDSNSVKGERKTLVAQWPHLAPAKFPRQLQCTYWVAQWHLRLLAVGPSGASSWLCKSILK